MQEKEYTGCVYADPCETAAEVTWRRDPVTGRDFPWDLTRAQMAKLDLKNLPVRLEHVERDNSAYDNQVTRPAVLFRPGAHGARASPSAHETRTRAPVAGWAHRGRRA